MKKQKNGNPRNHQNGHGNGYSGDESGNKASKHVPELLRIIRGPPSDPYQLIYCAVLRSEAVVKYLDVLSRLKQYCSGAYDARAGPGFAEIYGAVSKASMESAYHVKILADKNGRWLPDSGISVPKSLEDCISLIKIVEGPLKD